MSAVVLALTPGSGLCHQHHKHLSGSHQNMTFFGALVYMSLVLNCKERHPSFFTRPLICFGNMTPKCTECYGWYSWYAAPLACAHWTLLAFTSCYQTLSVWLGSRSHDLFNLTAKQEPMTL